MKKIILFDIEIERVGDQKMEICRECENRLICEISANERRRCPEFQKAEKETEKRNV